MERGILISELDLLWNLIPNYLRGTHYPREKIFGTIPDEWEDSFFRSLGKNRGRLTFFNIYYYYYFFM